MGSLVRCECHECGTQFSLRDTDIALMPTMKAKTAPPKTPYLETWADWVYHITTHCEECRYAQPPSDCIADLLRHTEKQRQLDEALAQDD